MAVTGAIFNSLIFGGINSADYGIYITGEAVYNAPERAVEMVSVPGRNGAIVIDQGHWNNIQVTYPAGTFGKTQEEFREAVSAFRNAVLSQLGYQRLTDTYHPDEYRMAVYVSGLGVDPTHYGAAGEFKLKFDCKPQRWLTEGEQEMTVSDGDVLLNPTPYDASPLLMVEGYGTIGFNGYDVEIENAVMGEVELAEAGQRLIPTNKMQLDYSFNRAMFNDGDTITVNPFSYTSRISGRFYTSTNYYVLRSCNVRANTLTGVTASVTVLDQEELEHKYSLSFPEVTFSVGEAKQVENRSYCNVALTERPSGSTITASSQQIIFRVIYDGDHTISLYTTVGAGGDESIYIDDGQRYISLLSATGASTGTGIWGYSTVSLLGHPTYIDCDLGDAYMIKDGSYISLNSYIDLGSDLPVLASGNNPVTMDNTITELKIVPRWWIL